MGKVCSKCKEDKSVDEFNKDKSMAAGLYPSCKACNKASCKRYYAENTERAAMLNKRWRENNKESYRLARKNHREVHKEEQAARHKKWRIENPEKTRANNQSRRARKAALPATLTVQEWQWLVSMTEGCCVYCGVATDKLHQEHVIPLSQNGEYTIANIRPACPDCNFSKGARTPEEVGMELISEYEDAIQEVLQYQQERLF